MKRLRKIGEKIGWLAGLIAVYWLWYIVVHAIGGKP
jgi:hypothetical protein